MAIKCYTGTVVVNEAAAAGTYTTIKDIAALASGFRQRISSVWVDGTNLTISGTIRLYLYLGAAGADERLVEQYDLPIDAGAVVNLLAGGPIEIDTRITIKYLSGGVGAGNVNVYYRIPYDDSIEKLQSVFNNTGATDDVDLECRHLHINSDVSDAVEIQCSAAAGNVIHAWSTNGGIALNLGGHGAGVGLLAAGGQTGDGVSIVGGATSGHGIDIITTDGNGIDIDGQGAGRYGVKIQSAATHALYLRSLANGNGLYVNGATAGVFVTGTTGMDINATAGIGIDIDSTVQGITIDSSGSTAVALTGGAGANHGLHITAGATGNAILAQAAGADAVRFEATAGNNDALTLASFGSGHCANLIAGATGYGVYVLTTSGHGMSIRANGVGANAINIVSVSNHAFNLEAGGNGYAIRGIGSGAGHGVYLQGGATGNGLWVGAAGASAVRFEAYGGNNIGLDIVGFGSGAGTRVVGGATGNAILAQAAGAAAVLFQATAGNNRAMQLSGFGTGDGLYIASGAGVTGNGITVVSNATVSGIGAYLLGAVTGEGLRVDGGANGNAVEFLAGGGNSHALVLSGIGAGYALYATGGATGGGAYVAAGGGNASGVEFRGAGTGHGFTMVMGGGAGSHDIDADEISAIYTGVITTLPTTLNRAFQRLGQQIQTSGGTITYVS